MRLSARELTPGKRCERRPSTPGTREKTLVTDADTAPFWTSSHSSNVGNLMDLNALLGFDLHASGHLPPPATAGHHYRAERTLRQAVPSGGEV